MPCALLIVTSAFLSSVSDWRVCQGGRGGGRGGREWGYSSEEMGSVWWWKNSVLWSHLSCQRADTDHPGTQGLWCSESGHWPRFTPHPSRLSAELHHPSLSLSLSLSPATSHLQNSPQPPHLICFLLSSRLHCFLLLPHKPSSVRLPVLLMLSLKV